MNNYIYGKIRVSVYVFKFNESDRYIPAIPDVSTSNPSDMPKLKKTLLMKKQILLGKRKKLLKKE